jgi:hypothetical protein
MPTIEIVRRQASEHRAGWFSLHIDGWDTEYMNDPSQHYQRMLGRLISEGRSAESPETIVDANDLAIEQSKYVLQRIADRLSAGKLFPGGMPFDPAVYKLTGQLPKKAKLRASYQEACQAFLNRGNFMIPVIDGRGNVVDKRAMTEDERVARIRERNTKRDHEGEWRERRKALIQARGRELETLRNELPGCDAKHVAKLVRRLAQLEAEVARLEGSGIFAATHGYQYAYGQYLQAGVNFVSGDIRLVPCMTNTTADTERDAKDQVSDFTTLDEADGSGYSSGGSPLDNQAVNIDDGNDRAECDADDETITSFGACTRPIQGELVILFSVSLNNSMPLHWLEYASTKTPDGSDFTRVINAEGYIQAA